MIGQTLLSATILILQVPETSRPGDQPKPTSRTPAAKAAAIENPEEAMARYNEMKQKTPATAAAQWRLALWCEKHGLKPEAYVHFAEVLRLDPRRDAVWRKLGFKKVGYRWLTDAQIAEDEEQKKADKLWGPRLKKIHKDIHGTNGAEKKKLAQAAVEAITDPRAVLSLYREFGGGGQTDQLIVVQVLGQIDKPISSKVLAMFAVFGRTPEVRQRATETLRGRTADDFLDLFLALLIDPINFEVKPVGGPGSPGAIFIEGKKANVARYYAPPPVPEIAFLPGDMVTYDPAGMPAIARPMSSITLSDVKQGVPGSKTLVRETSKQQIQYAVISPYQLQLEAQKGAFVAQAQLRNDVEQLRSINMQRKQHNDQVIAVAKDATGKDFGTTPKQWREGLAAAQNSPKKEEPTQKPIIPEIVPLAYNPIFMPSTYQTQVVVKTGVFNDS
jgi:hypothetical protein